MADDSPTRGIKYVSIAGQRYALLFTWSELAQLEAKYEGKTPDLSDMATVAEVAEIGFQQHHPEMTAEKIRAASPPLFLFQSAVQEALKYAYWGGGDPEKAVSGGEDKTGKKPRRLWRKVWRWLSVVACRRANSGG